ncbi:C-C motif chemokine 4-like [Hemicordylus capensis]|uniref:C-C motif chemokine 4-like n=1 Tax=Hemicordylus capensis TaxID=884348 RepID=UPI0023046DF2|nr:C-C motif chemokine 4-like [Hemicordylus capensis]
MTFSSKALLAVLLVATAAFFAQTEANPFCCISYNVKPVPRNLLVSYQHTSSVCALPAIAFVTKGGRIICADPRQAWTQDRLEYLRGN